jgi:hypothetical protein
LWYSPCIETAGDYLLNKNILLFILELTLCGIVLQGTIY